MRNWRLILFIIMIVSVFIFVCLVAMSLGRLAGVHE